MAATTQINQFTGTNAATEQADVSTIYWMSADVVSNTTNRDANPITIPGAGTDYSYENWQQLEITGGTFTSADTFRHYIDAAPGSGRTIFTSAQTGTPSNPSGTTPVDTNSTIADQAMPTTDPAASTINGSLTGVGSTGYVVTQLDVASTATAGFSGTLTWAWDEVV